MDWLTRLRELPELPQDHIICVNLSGRGDKDAVEAARVMGVRDLPDMSLS